MSAEAGSPAALRGARYATVMLLGASALILAAGCSSSSNEDIATPTTAESQPASTAAQEGGSGAEARPQTSGAGDAGVFTLARTRRCLNNAGLHAYLNPHNTAVMGSGGELRVVFGFGTDWIYIAFGRDAAEARQIQARAVAATRKQYPQVDAQTVIDSVRLRKNVFYWADGGPVTVAEGRQIDACLR